MTSFLAANWVWIALVAAFVVIHRRGHGAAGTAAACTAAITPVSIVITDGGTP